MAFSVIILILVMKCTLRGYEAEKKVRIVGCGKEEKSEYTFFVSNAHSKRTDRQLANVRQEYELKINVSSYIKHALK